ncbi:MAG: SMP-30/gluconolactonase/LRE family protein [Hyphomicrobiaceae bacterium]
MELGPLLETHRDVLGEAPFWDAETETLYWVDINPGIVRALHPATGRLRHWQFAEPVGAAVPRVGGGMIVAMVSGLYTFDLETKALAKAVVLEPPGLGNRPNEARVDPQGRLWVGTMQNDVGPDREEIPVTRSSGVLYRIDADMTVTRHETGVGVSNTLCWDEARGRLYFGDSLAEVIWVYDWDAAAGQIANRRVFAATKGHGVLDGSALDAEGYLWNARWGGACLIRYAPDGSIDRIQPTPARQLTSCVFGGADRRTLYVTTAGIGSTGALDGALLVAEAPVAGEICTRFAG